MLVQMWKQKAECYKASLDLALHQSKQDWKDKKKEERLSNLQYLFVLIFYF